MKDVKISVIATVDGKEHDISDMCVGGIGTSTITALECVTNCLDDPQDIIAEYIRDEDEEETKEAAE